MDTKASHGTSPWSKLAGLVIVCVLAFSPFAEATCSHKLTSTTNGTCVIYPANGLCGSAYAGRRVFLPSDTPLIASESLVKQSLELLTRNADQVTAECIAATERYVCANFFPDCYDIDEETVVPRLVCQSDCEAYWQSCQSGFDLYLYAIQTFHIGSISDVNIIHCGTGTWTADPQPSDVFGVRNIPLQPTWLEGYRGELRHPVGAGRFALPNGTNVSVPCENIRPLASSVVIDNELQCAYPMTKIGETGSEKCVLPCPFPVIPLADLKVIGWAFIGPALLGMAFSVFVCLDTSWVIFDTTEGFSCYNRVRKYWMRGTQGSRHEGSSADNVASGGGESSGTTGRGRYRGKVRSSMIYALLGSLMGIVYFIIGPLMTLISFEKISCDNQDYLEMADLLSGVQKLGDSMCEAQRIAPFILQGIFNLMLYALFRVLITVDQRFKQWKQSTVDKATILALAYCGLGPFVTMGIALGVDKTTDDITLIFGQLARNSAICTMRLTVAQEVILVFLPFIITGCLISALSLYIWMRLSSIQAGVQGMVTAKNRSSDRALRLLMLRLSVLGVTTFAVIIILIGSTAYIINAMEVFSPRFNSWFGCETVATNCAVSADCDALKESAYSVSPTFSAFAVQIAAMSCISLLLSGFFAAQALPRFWNEFRSGDLAQKLDNILEGRPLHYHVGESKNESSVNENVKSGNATSPGRVGGKVHLADETVAAYMSGSDTTASPVFEHEMKETVAGSRRVEAASSG